MEFAALVPLGPAEIEIERARDLYDSLVAYEPEATIWFVLVDDCLRSRRLRERLR